MVGLAAFLGSRKVDAIWFYSVFPLPFCVLIMISLLDERRSGYLRHRSLVLLGEASFALYLIHHPLIDFLNLVARSRFGGHPLLVDLIAVAFCVFSSVSFYKFIESPVTRGLKSRFMGKAQARHPSPLPSG
jgi:peptidoglycan/LPS O-acetylase OafA/YrhL